MMKVNSVDNKVKNNQNQPAFGLSPKFLEKLADKAFNKGLEEASFKHLRQADAFKKGAKLRRQILDDGNPYKDHLSVYKVINEFETKLENSNIYTKAYAEAI